MRLFGVNRFLKLFLIGLSLSSLSFLEFQEFSAVAAAPKDPLSGFVANTPAWLFRYALGGGRKIVYSQTLAKVQSFDAAQRHCALMPPQGAWRLPRTKDEAIRIFNSQGIFEGMWTLNENGWGTFYWSNEAEATLSEPVPPGDKTQTPPRTAACVLAPSKKWEFEQTRK